MTQNNTLRQRGLRIVGSALPLMLAVTAFGAAPAAAATSSAAPARTTATATTATAGASWSSLMRRRLNLDAEGARLTASLPGLRAAITAKRAELTAAQKAVPVAQAALTTAAAADQGARKRHATAKATVAAARKAVTDAQRLRPRNTANAARVTTAKQALTTATSTLKTRSLAVRTTTANLAAARRANTAAERAVPAATTAHDAAVTALSTAQTRIAALPKLRTDLAARASVLGPDVVNQTRASFTTAQTTRVYGVTVNRIVAFPFQRMIDDAAKAGVPLSGGGFRTREQQIALRKANGCPDVWTAPSSSCRVPTAIPGRSLHEIGLAVDMTSGGRSITDRKGKAFTWMAANAGRYGFVNYPAEAWHWSITGN
ncbi:M15 family metallopeptidase [Actinoplanes sp. NPDC051851]|uniref:M15 family metallopeptidase n=1 Tax=Actinoplanes sp. NPDC051851 TaxID=3154753 RepID=UPI0034269023